jgi:hypothetical protein
MEKEFVPYELALKLKQLGFDEPCLALYLDNDKKTFTKCMEGCDTNSWLKEHMKVYGSSTTAPLFQQAFRWFREKHQKNNILFSDGYQWTFDLRWADEDSLDKYPSVQFPRREVGREMFDTYEEAELACVTELIEIAENV